MTITPKKRATVEALLTHASISQAASAANVSRRSIHRWMRDDEFLAELHRAEDLGYEELRRTLAAGKSAAIKALLELMMQAQSESVRRRAATDWLTLYLRLHEIGMEARVQQLEAQVYVKN